MTSEVDKSTFLKIFTTVFLPMFLAAVDQTLLATATPNIVRELGNLPLSSWIAIGYMLAGAATVPIYGWLGDLFGRKNMLLMALGIFALGSVCCALSTSMEWLVINRVVQGIGSGGLMILSQALIGEWVAPRQKAKYQGYFSSLFALSSMGGPVLGGFIVTYLNWHWLFWLNLPLIGIAVYRLLRTPSSQLPKTQRSLDVLGLMLFPIMTTLLIYWLSSGGHYFPWRSSTSYLLCAIFVIVSTLFVLQQRRVNDSFLPLGLLKRKIIYRPLCSSFIFAACLFSLAFFLPIFLQVVLGLDAAKAGAHMIPMSAGMITGSYCTGKWIGRTGVPKYLPVMGFTLSAIMFLLLGTCPLSPWVLSLLALGCGLGLGTVMPATQVTIQTVSGKANLGRITAMAGLCRSLGGSVGTALFGTLIYSLIPNIDVNHSLLALLSAPHDQVVEAFQTAFKVAAILALIGACNAASVPRIHLDDFSFEVGIK